MNNGSASPCATYWGRCTAKGRCGPSSSGTSTCPSCRLEASKGTTLQRLYRTRSFTWNASDWREIIISTARGCYRLVVSQSDSNIRCAGGGHRIPLFIRRWLSLLE